MRACATRASLHRGRMIEDIDDVIENTRKRVEEMNRLTHETSRLLGETKKAEAELDMPTSHLQDRHSKESTGAE